MCVCVRGGGGGAFTGSGFRVIDSGSNGHQVRCVCVCERGGGCVYVCVGVGVCVYARMLSACVSITWLHPCICRNSRVLFLQFFVWVCAFMHAC